MPRSGVPIATERLAFLDWDDKRQDWNDNGPVLADDRHRMFLRSAHDETISIRDDNGLK